MLNYSLIESAIRVELRDADGSLFAPVAAPVSGIGSPGIIYRPGCGVFFAGMEVHLVTVSLTHDGQCVAGVELLCDNGYTVSGTEDDTVRALADTLASIC